MTREEAIEILENHTQYFVLAQDLGALNMAIDALRPVSREQVEKVWRGCECCSGSYTRQKLGYQYCENCGAPLTDEAVDIRLKELESLYGDR